MGAWGHGTFENDAALDWLGNLSEGTPSLVGDSLSAVAEAGEDQYLDADECCAVLAAADLVAAARGKGEDRLSQGARTWLAEHRATVAAVEIDLARRAVERVSGASELRELWDENGADTEWHADVRELLRRLSA